jgi:hypothetical protein
VARKREQTAAELLRSHDEIVADIVQRIRPPEANEKELRDRVAKAIDTLEDFKRTWRDPQSAEHRNQL